MADGKNKIVAAFVIIMTAPINTVRLSFIEKTR